MATTDAKGADTPQRPQSTQKRPSGRRLPKAQPPTKSPPAAIVAPSATALDSAATVERGEKSGADDGTNGPRVSPELAREVCEMIANGLTERFATYTVRAAGRYAGTHAAMTGQLRRHYPEILGDAHERCASRWLDELEELGRTGRLRGEGEERQDPRVVATRIASLQWLLSKKDRARWGDKREESPQDTGPQITVVLADARALARDVEGDPPALPASQAAARRLARGPR